MATRWYFKSTTAAQPKPDVRQSTIAITTTHWLSNSYGGGQDWYTPEMYPCDMDASAGSSAVHTLKNITEPGSTHNGWVKSFISPALGAQTISGTIAFVADFLEGSTNQNMMPMIYVYVWKSDDSGSRGNLFGTAAAPIISTLEANTTSGSLQTFTFASYTLSSLAISEGDRIVVEVMFQDQNTKTSAYDHDMYWNGAVSSGSESYVEFSMNIALKPDTKEITKLSDAKFLKVGEITKLSDAKYKKTQETSKLSDARFKKTQELTKLSDARWVKVFEITKLSDARFKKTMEMTKLGDARFKKLMEMTRLSDAKWIRYVEFTKLSDARFLKVGEFTKTSDAQWGVGVTTYEFTKLSDALYKKMQELSRLSDARYLKVQELSRLADARFLKTQAVTKNSDARYLKTQETTRPSDAKFKKTMELTKTSDAWWGTPPVGVTESPPEWLKTT